jgi:hypothetical protein
VTTDGSRIPALTARTTVETLTPNRRATSAEVRKVMPAAC